MAYIDPSVEQDQIQPGQAPAGQAPVAAGGAGIGGATKQSASTPGQNTPAQPSAQLSAYLSANAPQANQMAGQVANTLGPQTQAAQNAIAPAVNVYSGQLYTVPTDQATNEQVSTAPSQLTPQQTASYQTELQAGANAPNSANTFEASSGYQPLTTQIQNAVQQANLWNAGNNTADLSTALQPFESQNATAGDTTLDALLLSGTPGAYSQIQQAVAPAANLQSNLTAATTQADQSLQNAIAQDNATTAAAQAAPQTYATNLTAYLQNAVNQATQGDAAQSAQILSDLTNDTPTQADLATLGVTAAQWSTLSADMASANAVGAPVNLSQYLTQTAPNVTEQNIATPTQYADVAALQNILGANAPVEPIGSATASQAGTAPTEAALNQFNLTGAENAADTNAQLGNLQNEAKQLAGSYVGLMNAWANNHDGGQTPTQFQYIIDNLNAQLAQVSGEIGAITGTNPGYSVPFFNTPTGQTWINQVGSGNISQALGLAQGSPAAAGTGG